MRTQELVPEVLDAVEDRQRFMEAGFSLHIYPLLLSRIIWGGLKRWLSGLEYILLLRRTEFNSHYLNEAAEEHL